MDADATKPRGTPETVTPDSDSLITQNEAQEDLHKPTMAHTQCAQETATFLERTVSTEPKANEKLDADVNTQNVAPDEGGGAAECGDQKTAVKIPREHARLDALLSQIPKKAQQGLLMQCDLILTCIDASEHYIALGTNIGLTFLYDRKDHSMQRLKSETSSDVITCVKLHHGVDHQLAAGMASGALCIFFIPSVISLHKQQLQKFDVRSVHRHYITCVEWSTNGMKLFSGDKTGHVVTTEVDFYQGQCKSSELLVEPPTEVIQLNYDHKVLLVSTKQRSFICRLDTTLEIVQIGQQERKVQGSFGACFVPALCKVEDAVLYATRPGCRIWFSNIRGTVCNTHIFKDSVGTGVREIPILRPSRSTGNSKAELQFGRLLIYRDKQLITYNTTTLFVLDPQMNQVVACQSRLGGIVDVAVHGNEVFVLRRHTEDAVIRIADDPEVVYHKEMTFDLSLLLTTSTSTTTTTTNTSMTTATSETPATHKQDAGKENKTKTFFKKTFFTPFKKLDNFIQEHTFSKESHAHPPQDLSPVIKSDAGNSLAQTTPNTNSRVSEDSSPDLPPVVALDSPDLAVRMFTGGQKGSGTPPDIQSPDSAHSALSVFGEEVGDKQGGGVSPTSDAASGTSAVRVEVTGPENGGGGGAAGQEHLAPIADPISLSAEPAGGNDDIIFSHQMHKKKAKRKKQKEKGGNKESDTISQSSYGSQISEEPKVENDPQPSQKGVGDTLRRAEEALTNVDKLLRGSSDKDKSKEQSESEIPPCEAAVTVEDSTIGKGGDQIDSVSVVGSSQTLVDESESREGVGTVLDARVVGDAPVSVAKNGEDDACVAKVNQADKEPLAPAVQPSSDKTVPRSDTKVQCGDAVAQPSAVPVDVPSGAAVAEGEDPLLAAEKALDYMTRQQMVPVKKEQSVDDFYSMFSGPCSPTDPLESPTFMPKEHRSFSEFESGTPEADRRISMDSGGLGSEKSLPEPMLHKLANSWSKFTTPANIYSLGLSSTHIWFTAKGETLYYSALGGVKGIVWHKVLEPANQISVSPSGHIVWRLYRGRVFAGTKITQRRPEGLKWVEAVRDVAHISVDDNCAWYVKVNGDVMMQRGLSRERPCFRSIGVETECRVKQVMARHGVVWAITETLKLLVRTGISNEAPQGLRWQEIDRHSEPFLFTSVTIDNEGIGWAVDVPGQIWFTDGVSPSNPSGSGRWWQVPLSEYYVQDSSVLDMIRSIAKKFDTQKLSHILSTNRGGLIVAGVQGVWLSLDYLNTLYVCRSSLQGYHWSLAQPSQMATATVWKQVQAGAADLDCGMVWAQPVNGELYAVSPDSSDASLVASPVFVSYGVNSHAVWGLTCDGEVYIRTGMGPHCPLGVNWTMLDLEQLGENLLVHLSCNSSFVWVVDADGRVFHRIGAAAPKVGQLNPVWLPIETHSEIVFTKVVNGPVDWMVWAVDNRRLTYVRVGISEEMPIGREWIHVPGIQAMDISVSSSGVWALNPNGEILFRYGITETEVSGNYWKKIPGCFIRVSASSTDVLWAVNTLGQLVRCSSRHLFRRQDSADPLIRHKVSSSTSEDGDWELV